MQSDVLLNSCDVCDVEWIDDEGEGGCGGALMSPIMLDEKAKKRPLKVESIVSHGKKAKNIPKVSPISRKGPSKQ